MYIKRLTNFKILKTFVPECSREADCAKEIIDICELELLAAELCPECFLKEHNREKDELWFIKPCLVIEN